MRWPLPWPKSWRTREDHPEGPGDGDEHEEEEQPPSLRMSAILLSRDIGVALLVVAVVMILLFAYARVWPPMVVVESGSMEHNSEESSVGAIDTGDLVLVQSVESASDVVTYVEGRITGYETYSNHGDVIVFYDPTVNLSSTPAPTPIIHRAILYVTPNATGGGDVPALTAWPTEWWYGDRGAGQIATTPYGLRNVTLVQVRSYDGNRPQWKSLSWNLSFVQKAGFLTKGDHNANKDDWGGASVDVPRIVGKARGELPWFGLIKLSLAPGNRGCCPNGWGDPLAAKNSWDALLVSLVVIIAGPFLVDYGWALFMERRKAKRRATGMAKEDGEPPPAGPIGSVGDAPPLGAADTPPSPEPEVTDEARTGSSAPEDDDL